MKCCPNCGRQYDVTMAFCLDDGSELVYGPAADGSATALLPGLSAEGATRRQIRIADETPSLPDRPPISGEQRAWIKRSLLIVGIAAALVLAGLSAYKYLLVSSTGEIHSIAVLPFENSSGDPDIEYLSDGMAETLISSLTSLPSVDVKPRSTVFRYKGRDMDPRSVGKELNVQAVLSGRVVQRGQEFSVFVELIDISRDKAIWSDTYSRGQADLVTLQTEIARDVSSKLQGKLSGTDQAKVTKIYTKDPEAYQLYLKGRYNWNKRTPDSLRQAVQLYKQAIEKDPSFALAYSGLGETYVVSPFYGVASSAECMPQAKAAVDRALELDETIPAAHAARGKYLAFYEYDRGGSEREFRRAIELDPNYATAHQWLGLDFLVLTKRFDEGLRELKAAIQIDPLSPVIGSDTAFAYWNARRFDEAEEQARKVLTLEPNFPYARAVLGQALDAKGRYAEAIVELRRSLQLADDPYSRALLIGSLARSGKRAEAESELASLESMSTKSYVPNVCLAIAKTALGDKEAAIRLLQKDVEERSAYAVTIGTDLGLSALHDDPRFAAMLKRMNLPE